ncbi:MAG: tetratricopeptide repeat protein [Bacteroidota bacterium]|nr:tetratricopeptide repeat protein [Bacteroidota bacterium]MDP3556821.1 tetratricopeptide repeat protein [Bacteroidota bacterium]
MVISFSFSQTNIDSLKIVTSSRAHDTLKFAAYNSIINFYWKSDLKQALAFSKINLSFALKKNIDKYIAIAYNNLSGTYYFMGDYQNANLYNFKTLNIRLKKQQDGTTVGSKKSIASTYNNIASIYLKLANYTKSIEYNLLALKIKEDINDSLGMARSYTNIGNVYEKINKRTLALKFQKQALELMLILNDGHGIGAAYNNIGNILLKENDYKNAKINFEKAIEIRKKIEDVEGLYTTYNNLGELNYELKNYVAAKKYFELAWEYFSESSDPYLRTSILINLGEIYKFVNQEKKAEEYLKIAIGIAQKNKMPEIEKAAYDALAGMYFNLRNFEKAYTNLRMYNDINDTIYKLANSKKTAELQALYDDAQKTNQIESLKKEKIESDLENSKKELEIQKQKSFKNLLLSGLVVLILLGFLLFNRFSIKSKLNKKLEFQNQQIAAKNNDITNSINYAKRIQDAILPSIKYVNNYIPDNFILYKPKDIVAGDFYWFERVNGISFIAAADCTGHGVPGAMVSVVCSNALNRAVFEFGITEPGLILDKTRELVLDTFSKSDEEVKDGMDISLIAIHETENGSNKREIKWAGANNPLWLIQNGELLEIKSHKQSVGVTINPTNFPTHNLDLSLGDTLYLFTDGFQDQFGGENAKKFKAAKFKDLLVSINMYSVQKQKQLIENCFQEWKGDLEQVDDICVIGIRL